MITNKPQAIAVSDSFLFNNEDQPIWGHIDVINHLGIPYQLIIIGNKYSENQLKKCITESFIYTSELPKEYDVILTLNEHEGKAIELLNTIKHSCS